KILKHKPVAVELLDSCSLLNAELGDMLESNCLLFVEFHDTAKQRLKNRIRNFEMQSSQYSQIVENTIDPDCIQKFWNERKNALNNVLKMTIGSRTPLGIIEDTVIDPCLLKEFVVFLTGIYKKHNVRYVIYGHAGDGNLHTRPIVNMGQDIKPANFKKITLEVFKFIISHGGSISAEHGDGLARVKYVPEVYGRHVYKIFVRLKTLFDEKN